MNLSAIHLQVTKLMGMYSENCNKIFSKTRSRLDMSDNIRRDILALVIQTPAAHIIGNHEPFPSTHEYPPSTQEILLA